MKSPKTSKGQKTKESILEKSINLIKKKGFAGVTLQDLCRASGVANGTFYHYFSSTTDILRELILQEVEDLESFYEGLTTASSFDKLLEVLRYGFDYFERKGRDIVASIYLHELKAGNSIIDPYTDGARKLLHKIIQEGQDKGEFSTAFQPEFFATNILALVFYNSFQWILEEKEKSLADIAMDHLRKEISRMIG
ncbi:TetR/AcrR family transcriptional regulator [bacterium]|nr:TetR/AcrR family transcriptional regulator [bacterium]